VDFSGFMDSIISLAQNNTVIAVILALGLLYFLYRKPKLFFYPSLPWSLLGRIVLYDHEHGRCGLSAEKKIHSARGKAIRLKIFEAPRPLGRGLRGTFRPRKRISLALRII